MKYEELLKKAKEQLPEVAIKKERFEVPKAEAHIQGNKTILANFQKITDILGRKPEMLLKYLQRELATPASIDGPRLILGRRLNFDLINQKINQFANDFVLCKECNKPDTKLVREDRIWSIKCTACGAKHPVKAKIDVS